MMNYDERLAESDRLRALIAKKLYDGTLVPKEAHEKFQRVAEREYAQVDPPTEEELGL